MVRTTPYISRRYLREKWDSVVSDMNIILNSESPSEDPNEVDYQVVRRTYHNIGDKVKSILTELHQGL